MGPTDLFPAVEVARITPSLVLYKAHAWPLPQVAAQERVEKPPGPVSSGFAVTAAQEFKLVQLDSEGVIAVQVPAQLIVPTLRRPQEFALPVQVFP